KIISWLNLGKLRLLLMLSILESEVVFTFQPVKVSGHMHIDISVVYSDNEMLWRLVLLIPSTGSDSSLDDCVSHLICPCCTLAQESKTLEMNNVHDGTWHGRGDTMCIGTYVEVVFTFEPAMDATDIVDRVICTLTYRSFTLKKKCWGDVLLIPSTLPWFVHAHCGNWQL
ncbi:PLAC8 family protein, partial [Tanacetum coccineum]